TCEAPCTPPAGCMDDRRYSRNQSAIFPVLAKVNRAHHQARGFDRVRHSNRIGRLRVIELTPSCHNSVTNYRVTRSDQCERDPPSALGGGGGPARTRTPPLGMPAWAAPHGRSATCSRGPLALASSSCNLRQRPSAGAPPSCAHWRC